MAIFNASPRGSSPGRFALWVAVALALLLLDRLTKDAIIENLSYGMFVYVTSFFNLCHVRNTGAAFSFLGEAGGWQILVFAGLAAVVSAVCVWLIWRNARRTLFSASLALIVSGAVGNLWDRLVYGYVTDFLDFHAFGWHWPSFNVADICICGGAVLLMFDEFRKK